MHPPYSPDLISPEFGLSDPLKDKLQGHHYMYEGVSKSPRTMLITRKSLVVHEFPARVCCGGVLGVSVPSGVAG